MKAAVVHEFGSPLSIEELRKPEPGPGQVVVRVETSGLCHTDIHAAHGDWPVKPAPPFVPGHEGVGLVERVGAGVTRLREGDRVAVPWLGWACGACEACASGWETLCPDARYTGYMVDGGFAEYVLADAAFAGLVPEGIDPLDAAPLTCAGVTTYKAVKVSGARPSDLVAVFGVGGLGHLAVQYARIAGATVAAVDIVDSKLDVAKRLGAEYGINAATHDPVAAIQALGGADSAIVLAATPTACEQAFAQPQAQWSARPCRPPEGQHDAPTDLRDRSPREEGHRLTCRNPRRPCRDLRAPRLGPHHHRARVPATGRRERRHGRGPRRSRRRPSRVRPSLTSFNSPPLPARFEGVPDLTTDIAPNVGASLRAVAVADKRCPKERRRVAPFARVDSPKPAPRSAQTCPIATATLSCCCVADRQVDVRSPNRVPHPVHRFSRSVRRRIDAWRLTALGALGPNDGCDGGRAATAWSRATRSLADQRGLGTTVEGCARGEHAVIRSALPCRWRGTA